MTENLYLTNKYELEELHSRSFGRIGLCPGRRVRSQRACQATTSGARQGRADRETLQLLLGHADLDHVDPYLEVDNKKLRQAFIDVLP